ncbi:MAG: hypothetical protein EP338_10040 [Bacteroidetes bacterium]|nr:MAG: hypothetical protein EP338_10040 [Bacteroidota bacterium]
MKIKLNKNNLISDVNEMFNKDEEFPYYTVLKELEKKYALPKFKEAYNNFRYAGDEFRKQISDKVRTYDNACLMRDLIIKRLAEEFRELHALESSEYWAIPVKKLDFSIESLELIDGKNHYRSAFKSYFFTKHILPLVTGYVMHTILTNSIQHGWNVVYADSLYKTVLKPCAGKKEIYPYEYIKTCLLSGFKLSELNETLRSITNGLAENRDLWRRPYLSDVSNP